MNTTELQRDAELAELSSEEMYKRLAHNFYDDLVKVLHALEQIEARLEAMAKPKVYQ